MFKQFHLCMLLGACSLANAAEDCTWLAAAKVDQAFPDLAPWHLTSRGRDTCRFASDASGKQSTLDASRAVKASVAEAEGVVGYMKAIYAARFDVQPAPALGKHGFMLAPQSDTSTPDLQLVPFVGHRNDVLVSAALSRHEPITPAQRVATEKLAVDALAMADDSETRAKPQNKH